MVAGLVFELLLGFVVTWGFCGEVGFVGIEKDHLSMYNHII